MKRLVSRGIALVLAALVTFGGLNGIVALARFESQPRFAVGSLPPWVVTALPLVTHATESRPT